MSAGRTNEVFGFTKPALKQGVHVNWIDDDEGTEVEDEDEGKAELARYQNLFSVD